MSAAVQKPLLSYVPTWLPVLLIIFSIIAFGVRADAQIRDLRVKTDRYDGLMMAGTDRMARVEEQLKMQTRMLERIEHRLDEK